MLRKISFLLHLLFCGVEFEFSWLHNHHQILILKTEILLEFQNEINIKLLDIKSLDTEG